MYLSRSLRIDQKIYPMVGVFPVDTVLERKPQGHGYIRVEVSGPNPFYPLGAVLTGLIIRLAGPYMSLMALSLLGYIVWINIILAFFNLMPIPPLDGHWLLMAVIPHRWSGLRLALYRMQWLLLVLLIFFIFPLVAPLLIWIFRLLTGGGFI